MAALVLRARCVDLPGNSGQYHEQKTTRLACVLDHELGVFFFLIKSLLDGAESRCCAHVEI